MEGREPGNAVLRLENGCYPTSKTTLVVPKIYEYNRRGIDAAYPESALRDWHAVGRIYADLAVFWGGDKSIVLSLRPIPTVFVQYIQEHLGLRRLIRFPRQDTGRLCADVRADGALLRDLVSELPLEQPIPMLAYGATASLYPLVDALRGLGAPLVTPDIPARPNFWTSLYFDSKAGCRQLCAEAVAMEPALSMPEGFICHSLDQAIEYIRYFHDRNTGCVVKANLGVGGLATLILGRDWRRRPLHALRRSLRVWAAGIPYFVLQGPIIVEQEVIGPEPSDTGRRAAGAISAHAIVAANGETQVLGTARELRDSDNGYVGAEFGKGAVRVDLAAQVKSLVAIIGAAMTRRGYRGHIGIDLAIDRSGRPWLLEVNPRRCSSAHVYDIGARLFGSAWATTHYALSRLPLRIVVERRVHVEQVLDVVDRVNEMGNAMGVRTIPTCISGLAEVEPLIGYVVFGPDRQTVLGQESVLLAELARVGLHRAKE